MPQTGTANLADFESNTSPATASLDEFQPEVLPAAGPVTLNTKRGGSSGVLPPEPAKPSWRDYAGSAFAAATGMDPGAETGLSDFKSQEASQGLTETGTPGKRLTGALRLAEIGLEPTTALVGPAALENPLSVARGFAEGEATSKGAGYVAKKAGASDEQKSLVEDLAFWAPGVARSLGESLGLGNPKVAVGSSPEGKGIAIAGEGGTRAAVGVTPEEIRIGGQFRGGKPHEVRIPRSGTTPAQPAIEPPTIEGQIVQPPAPAPHPGAPVDNVAEGASNAVAMANEEAQAMRMASGMPATPPPPPVPPPPAPPGPPVPPQIAQGHISQDTAAQIGTMIAKLPPDLRAQATVEAHQTLSQSILQMGKVVTPSGKLEIITKPEQAEKVAQRIINEQVARQEKIQAESQSAAETAPTVAAPVSKFEEGLRARRAVKDVSTGSNVEQSAPAAPAPAVSDEGQIEAPHNSNRASLEEFTPQSSGPAASPVVPSQIGTAALSDLAPTNLLKGDQVVLPDGAKATVSWVSPRLSIVRVKTDQGKVISIGAKQLKSGQHERVNQPGWRGENAAQGASLPSARAGNDEQLPGVVPEGRPSSGEQPQRAEKVLTTVEPGKLGEMRVSDLKIAPHKFQYKLGTDAEGVGTLLKEQKVFNPDLAGVVSVWRDPADGKMYVVNGHHRVELAKRTGQKSVAVRHIKAKDAVAASAIGAQQNIAEGRGTALDAAKYFRDTGTTAEHLAENGISLGEATAKNGLALSHLDPAIFNRVVSGDLCPGRAVAIGEATKDPAEQKAILSLVEKKEAGRGKVSDETLSELIRMVKGSEQTTETTADLFGSREITRSLALEKAEISAHIKQQLAKDKKLFGFVAKGDRATELARAGNKIDVEKSKEISTGAAQAEEVYNKLSNRGGPISNILDESARRLADGENAGTVKTDAYQRVRAEVSQTLAGTEERSAGRSEGALEPQQPAEAETSQPEGSVEPTLPGMEHVPAERAEASAEQQGKDLTERLNEPPQSIEGKAGEIEQKSPLFRVTEANPQRDMFSELLHGESGNLELGKVAAPVSELFKQDVAPALSKAGVGLRDTAALFVKAFYPRIEESNPVGRWTHTAAPSDAVDALMKLKGDRARALSEFDAILSGIEKMFDKLPEDNRVDFIDRLQTGKKQPTQELDGIASALRTIMDEQRRQEQVAANLGRTGATIELSRKENYFHNWWNTPPGREPEADDDARISRLFSSRRPLEGTKGYNKRQSYTLKTGMEAGGKPETTNPVRILRHRIEDGMKFVTARAAWERLHELDLRQYVRQGERPPAGFDKVDDRIARVYFPADVWRRPDQRWRVVRQGQYSPPAQQHAEPRSDSR
jgi:hypothetical protein